MLISMDDEDEGRRRSVGCRVCGLSYQKFGLTDAGSESVTYLQVAQQICSVTHTGGSTLRVLRRRTRDAP